MPHVAEFFGITVAINFADHPPPHFHAEYGGDEILIEIDTLAVYRGTIRRRALAPVLEWSALHRAALRRNWERASRREPLERIPPLD